MSDAITCRQAVEKLWEFLDQELDDAACEQVREHLDACRACFPHYEFQRAYREFMATCRAGCAPPGLRRRILMSLLAEEER
ncbi:MAG TPA: mycothiol system anti-sigma-R factor [Longimicrobiales bacterium]|nr:mycothiol system anti-sigma-R factor [Longimicrobiales bacterium]